MGKQTAYIFSDGSLRRQGNTLCLEREDGKRHIPIQAVRDVFVFGEVDVNKRVLELLSQHEIIMHYFSYYGYYMGSFYPREHYNSGYMTLKQAEYYLDEERRMCLARSFVGGALRNLARVLLYYGNRGKNVENELDYINKLQERVCEQDSIEQLMALEGNARRQYYQAFDAILENPDFAFERRTRRPPENRLNALISFCNSLVYTTVLSEAYKTHLDPRIGFLHSTTSRRFSLNLDVAEIFKPLLADRLIFTLVGKRMIKVSSFDDGRGGIFLKESSRKTVVETYDERLKQTIKHKQLRRDVSYRELIRLELYKIQKHLMGEAEYTPFEAQW